MHFQGSKIGEIFLHVPCTPKDVENRKKPFVAISSRFPYKISYMHWTMCTPSLKIANSDKSAPHIIPSPPIYFRSLLSLKQWQASDVDEEKHISLYRHIRLWGPWVGDSFTTSCCRGRRWSRELQYKISTFFRF